MPGFPGCRLTVHPNNFRGSGQDCPAWHGAVATVFLQLDSLATGGRAVDIISEEQLLQVNASMSTHMEESQSLLDKLEDPYQVS